MRHSNSAMVHQFKIYDTQIQPGPSMFKIYDKLFRHLSKYQSSIQIIGTNYW